MYLCVKHAGGACKSKTYLHVCMYIETENWWVRACPKKICMCVCTHGNRDWVGKLTSKIETLSSAFCSCPEFKNKSDSWHDHASRSHALCNVYLVIAAHAYIHMMTTTWMRCAGRQTNNLWVGCPLLVLVFFFGSAQVKQEHTCVNKQEHVCAVMQCMVGRQGTRPGPRQFAYP
jgi:hypothetical protein